MSRSVKPMLIALASITIAAAQPRGPNAVGTFAVRLTGQAEANLAHPSGGTGDLSADGWGPNFNQCCEEAGLLRS